MSVPCVCDSPSNHFLNPLAKANKIQKHGMGCLGNSVPTRSVKIDSYEEKRPAAGQDAVLLNELILY